jgi:tRNA-Thr(GGU) m(6)t(6)A37 methyltransferase TsaA
MKYLLLHWSDPVGTQARSRGLAEEGIWLGRLVASLLPQEPEALGLLASMSPTYPVVPIGTVRSTLSCREQAPKQGREGAPDAWLELELAYREGARDLRVGQEILVLTWLDRAHRSVLAVHPRDDESALLTGVFSTRSADHPNPIGIHRVRILEIADGCRLRVSDLEALDRTPIVDLKPLLDQTEEG